MISCCACVILPSGRGGGRQWADGGSGARRRLASMSGDVAPGTPHRREDGEVLGWIRAEGDLWVPIDVLGRELSSPVEWLDAEERLEQHGLGYLAEPWMLDGVADRPVRVRLVEVTPQRIVVKREDFGAVDRPGETWTLDWPLPAELRAPRDGDPDPFVISAS